ncbi:discoidin domain-containing protein [Cohnella silvisoli]|uniref:Discoidin domain-containing protein n=1 Tax=Cohnella silvisoli TaxID=2873699 RepID=A0ABV1KRB2_9BACL|nr:LamG-like jellyroll fold domain-containing protein [Cohnella silvisoli]MCD9021677.1 discoidin domain-containing protein [Cohnella silvisoli]
MAVELLDEMFSFLDGNYSGDPSGTHQKISGWEVDSSGGTYSFKYYNSFKVTADSTIAAVTMKKQIASQTTGKLTLEFRFKLLDQMNGVEWRLDGEGIPAVKIVTSSGYICYENASGNAVTLQSCSVDTEYGIKVVADLGASSADIYVNGILKAQGAAFRNSVPQINGFYFTTSDEATGSLFFYPVKIHTGYAVYEKFIAIPEGSLPDDWTVGGTGGTAGVYYWNTISGSEPYSLKLTDTSSSANVTFGKTVSNLTGRTVWEYKFLLPSKSDGMGAELLNGNTTGVKIVTNGGNICYVNSGGSPVSIWDNYYANLWYSIKVDADPATDTADIYVNGKKRASNVGFNNAVSGFNALKYSTGIAAPGEWWLDDILLYAKPQEPVDYVPAPVLCASDNHYIGTQRFAGSREGYHLGWEWPYKYPEHDLYMGWFDEGNPEAMDWELKYMAEHGIDFFLECWYSTEIVFRGEPIPFKDPPLVVNSIEKAYFNSKYSSYVDFALFFTDAPMSSLFRSIYVPYWIEHYFKDTRYFTIDNKPVLAFEAGMWLSKYETAAAVKVEMDYLRQQLVNLGFAGGIFLARIDTNPDWYFLEKCYEMGFDYGYAYSFFTSNTASMKSTMTAQKNAGSNLGILPTISVGWSTEGWDGPYSGRVSVSDFLDLCGWAKNTFMPSLPSGQLGKQLAIVDNWSEYGEGHWINPGKLGGFGYVDALRSTFTGNPAHTDTIPTDVQKLRMNLLFPKGWIGRSWNFDSNYNNTEGWTASGIDWFGTNGKGYLNGTIRSNDPSITSPDQLNIAIGSNRYIRIKMKNGGPCNGAKIFFATTTSAMSPANAKSFAIKPNDPGYTEYIVDMSTVSGWTGTLKQLRIDPADDEPSSGLFSIDYILLTHQYPSGYTYPSVTPSTNLALNKTAYMLNGSPYATTGPEKAADGDKSTYAQSNTRSSWDFKVDLGVVTTINQVVLACGTDNYPIDYTIQVSTDNTNWITVKIVNGATSGNKLYNFPDIVARYVLLDVSGAFYSASGTWGWALNEFQVYNTGIPFAGIWNFDAAYNNTEDWKATGIDVFGTDGKGFLNGTIRFNDPSILSADQLNIAIGSKRYMRIKMKNDGPCGNAKIYFATTTSAISETNAKSFAIKPNDPSYSEYIVDMSTLSGWTGILKQLRIDPVNDEPSSGSFSIDYIVLSDKYPAGYAYPAATPSANLALNKSAFMLNGTPPAATGPEKAVDGNKSTFAQSNARVPWDFKVDLGSIVSINQAVIACGTDDYPTDYTIRTSTDNTNWITVRTVTGATSGNKLYNFPDITARYVLLDVAAAYYGNSGTLGWALDEFQVYDTGRAPKPACDWKLANNANDSAGTNNGTAYGGVVFFYGYANFDGVDDYISVADNPNLDAVNGFTLSAWVNLFELPSSGSNYALLEKSNSYRFNVGSTGACHVQIATANNGWYTAGTTASCSTVLQTDKWYNIAAVYDGSYVKVYLNGVLEGTGSQVISGNVAINGNALTFGHKTAPNIAWYHGKIRGVNVFNRALTASEIGNMYKA